jgi:DNA-binding winged helix-turn-helix (wHTH) protein
VRLGLRLRLRRDAPLASHVRCARSVAQLAPALLATRCDQLFELRKGGEIVAIQPKAFDILRCLVQSGDVVVARTDLMAKVWPGVVVTNDSLAQAIMAARAALGDDGDEPTFIHTVRGRGYRFMVPVESTPRARTKESVRPKTDRPPSTLVGRAQSLATMRKLLERARGGRGGLCLVTGESGVGKTRLVEELVGEARDVQSIFVRCYDGKAHRSCGRSRRRCGRYVRRERARSTSWRRWRRVVSRRRRSRIRRRGFALFDSIVRALTVRTDPRPLLFAIDDLHLADLDSLRLIASRKHSITNTAGHPIPKGTIVSWAASNKGSGKLTLSSDLAPNGTVDVIEPGQTNGYTCTASFVPGRVDLVLKNVHWLNDTTAQVTIANANPWRDAAASTLRVQRMKCLTTQLGATDMATPAIGKGNSVVVNVPAAKAGADYLQASANVTSNVQETTTSNNVGKSPEFVQNKSCTPQ